MCSLEADRWQTGERVLVRGRAWTIVELTKFSDCDALRLSAAGAEHAGDSRTLLVPFDRPWRLRRSPSIRVVRPRRWLHALRQAGACAHPAGRLKRTARSAIDVLPYQLEPALAMIGLGVPRLMIADAVGLGKTIQAGIILNECAFERESFRALVVAPAGLREQWSHELADRFGLDATVAGAAWLARSSRELPADVNPWILPGIYVTSFDFVKQPEVLRPLEDADWDVLVVDEAHGAALRTARRAAVHAIAVRSRRVLLLTATPHAGDSNQFDALCRIGETAAEGDRLMLFNRSRADAGTAASRRTALLPVRLTEAERRMHRLLDRYTARVCREAQARGDARARLAAIILKKRALSSAASLAVSARRRLALLASPPVAVECQLILPLGDEDPLEDDEPDAALAAPGLSDTGRERRWLKAIVEAAHNGSHRESKTRFLLRLLSRIRQPAIVFTEYRDTLERLRDVLTAAGHDVAVLHGGLSPAERSAVQQAFNGVRLKPSFDEAQDGPESIEGPDTTDKALLLATDAASEGLNLHQRCRVVVHYELPWSPARLEQRTGRVDRIGQSRRVHEILLVAGDTAERLVLAPLAKRASRARSAMPGASRLVDVLTESRVASAVMDGEAIVHADREPTTDADMLPVVVPPLSLHEQAESEARRLRVHREWIAASGGHQDAAPVRVSSLRIGRSTLKPGLICVYTLTLSTERGDAVHTELAVVHEPCDALIGARTPASARPVIREFLDAREPAVRAALLVSKTSDLTDIAASHSSVVDALQRRERALMLPAPSAARELVQGGLFDGRALRAQAARTRAASALLAASEERLESLASAQTLTTAIDLSAILIAFGAHAGSPEGLRYGFETSSPHVAVVAQGFSPAPGR
jgi:superfamily II DNA or RNA helicase